MQVYPYNLPIILTDDIFISYGGQTGTTTVNQRQSAYLIAEKRVTNYIGTFLLPTTISGTYSYNANNFIVTEYGYVSEIKSASLSSINNINTCSFSSTDGCVFIFEDTFGYLNFSCIQNKCNCYGWQTPYQYNIVYVAGLPTGTANQPDILLAITIVAQEQLNEMSYPTANEAVGARGIEEFTSLDYHEKRKPLKRTALGQSAKANFASELLDNAVKKARPYLGI